jgi:hypothetical protein
MLAHVKIMLFLLQFDISSTWSLLIVNAWPCHVSPSAEVKEKGQYGGNTRCQECYRKGNKKINVGQHCTALHCPALHS